MYKASNALDDWIYKLQPATLPSVILHSVKMWLTARNICDKISLKVATQVTINRSDLCAQIKLRRFIWRVDEKT